MRKLVFDFDRYLAPKPLTLTSHPTMDYISIASWFAMGNHGNQGDRGMPNSDVFEACTCLDMTTQTIESVKGYDKLRVLFDGKDAGKYCVLDVTWKSEI